MTALTTDQLQAIRRAGSDPVRLEDPETRRTYVLLGEDEYRRLRALLLPDETTSLGEQRTLLADLGRSVGWDDPAMDVYNDP